MTIQELAFEIARAASAKKASCARQLAEAVARNQNQRSILLICAEGSTANDCAVWLRERLGGPTVNVVSAAEDFAPAALAADHAVLVFPCSGIPGSEMIRRWQTLVGNRPGGSSSVILEGAEEIESAEDQKLVESTVRRWLLPGEESETVPLRELGVYLWSTNPVRPDERDLLCGRLAHPLSDDDLRSLNITRLTVAIHDLEELTPALEKPLPRIRPLEDSISAVRASILKRTRKMRDDAELALRLAFDDLENRFERELPTLSDLAANGDLSPVDLQAFVQTWEQGQMAQSVERILTLGQEATIDTLKAEPCLAALVPPSLEPSLIHLTLQRIAVNSAPCGGLGPGSPWTVASRSYVHTAGAAVVTPLIAMWLGLGPIGVIGGTIATAAGTLAIDRMNRRTAATRIARTEISNGFHQRLTETRREFLQVLDEKLTKLIDDWKSAFDALPQPINAPPKPQTTTTFDAWKNTLAEMSQSSIKAV